MKSRKSWIPKLNPEQEIRIVVDKRDGAKVLIPTPMLLATEIRKIRKGQVRKMGLVRQALAGQHAVERTCPLVTGIFMAILAGAAAEQFSLGRKRVVAPYWRVSQDDGSIRTKEPPGIDRQIQLLKEEGHSVQRKGKKWFLKT